MFYFGFIYENDDLFKELQPELHKTAIGVVDECKVMDGIFLHKMSCFNVSISQLEYAVLHFNARNEYGIKLLKMHEKPYSIVTHISEFLLEEINVQIFQLDIHDFRCGVGSTWHRFIKYDRYANWLVKNTVSVLQKE